MSEGKLGARTSTNHLFLSTNVLGSFMGLMGLSWILIDFKYKKSFNCS